MVFWQQPGGRHPVGEFNGATTSYQVGSGAERLSKTPGKQQWLSLTNTADKTAGRVSNAPQGKSWHVTPAG